MRIHQICVFTFLVCLISTDDCSAFDDPTVNLGFSFGGFGFGGGSKKPLNESELIQSEYEKLIQCLSDDNKKACIIVCDQTVSGIYVYDLNSKRDAIWSFDFIQSKQIPDVDRPGFKVISDAKLVYRDYFLFCTSGGVIGIIDIKTKRILKYWHVSGNLHSIDIAPDGTVVAVASDENFIVVLPSITNYSVNRRVIRDLELEVDCSANVEQRIKKYWFPYGHAVVWDHHFNQHFWVGGNRTIKSYKYNYNNVRPELKMYQNFSLLDDQVHEMIPLPESNLLWLTTLHFIYLFNTQTGSIYRLYDIADVKSLSTDHKRLKSLSKALMVIEKYIDKSNIQNMYEQGGILRWKESEFKDLSALLVEIRLYGKQKNATIVDDEVLSFVESTIKSTIYVTPLNSSVWSTDRVLSLETHRPIFTKPGAQIYKARYLQYSSFSYDLFFPKSLDL